MIVASRKLESALGDGIKVIERKMKKSQLLFKEDL